LHQTTQELNTQRLKTLKIYIFSAAASVNELGLKQYESEQLVGLQNKLQIDLIYKIESETIMKSSNM